MKLEFGLCSNRTRCFSIVGYEGTLTFVVGSNFMFLFSVLLLVMISFILYCIMMILFSRYFVFDFFKIDLWMNLR